MGILGEDAGSNGIGPAEIPYLADAVKYKKLYEDTLLLFREAVEARDRHFAELGDAKRLIDELREIVDLTVALGGVRFHEEGCPEDDTCDCPDVKRVNDAMGRDWTSKRPFGSINLPTSEKRNDEPKEVCIANGVHCGGQGKCYCSCHKT